MNQKAKRIIYNLKARI
uniref:Uncharacterized protein n=1 Tax=Rhizophora mucronata TaxID=61149 RepID=A0A2P2R4I5_RHIMU